MAQKTRHLSPGLPPALQSPDDTMTIEGILFDMDGVLMNTMKYHDISFRRALKKLDVDVNGEEVYELEGEGSKRVIEEIFHRRDIELSNDEFEEVLERKRKVFREIEDSKPFPGMPELLEELKENYKLGLVSGSNRDNVMGYVDKFFPDVFDSIITEDDVGKQKPNPDPYLRCAESLGLDKSQVLVVENAPLGVESAKRAGMKCVAVASYVSPEKLKDTDRVFENHGELEQYLAKDLS